MKTSNEIFLDILTNPKYKPFCKSDIYNFPCPYYKNLNNVKAIVLGADPSNQREESFNYVFDLEKGDNSLYFKSILDNLKLLDLSLDNIYVQNLCKNYFSDVTDKNELFTQIAEKYWLPSLKLELDSLFKPKVPVFITAWKVMQIVVPTANQYLKSKKHIYENAIMFNETKLSRPVFALFRGGFGYYKLSRKEFLPYVKLIRKYLNTY